MGIWKTGKTTTPIAVYLQKYLTDFHIPGSLTPFLHDCWIIQNCSTEYAPQWFWKECNLMANTSSIIRSSHFSEPIQP